MDCLMPEALEAVLSIFPIDSFVEHPVNSMQVVGDAKAVPEVIAEAAQLLGKQQIKIASLERFKFYEATQQSFVIIQTTESRIYANLILSKGVISK
jgi:L-fucose mutarotase